MGYARVSTTGQLLDRQQHALAEVGCLRIFADKNADRASWPPTCTTCRARGVRLGQPPAMTAEQIRHTRDLLTWPGNTVSSTARLLGVSRVTI